MRDVGSYPVTTRVVRRVADVRDTDPADLPPLFDAIDPERLEEGVERLDDGEIRFRNPGFEVAVDADESVSVERASRSAG